VALHQTTATDAKSAGCATKEDLLAELHRRSQGEIYRIELGALLPDPRVALCITLSTTEAEFQALKSRLHRLDTRAVAGAWTFHALAVIQDYPGVRAADLCTLVGQEKDPFNLNVRKLKTLELTESLATGYCLSPRGEALLDFLRLEAETESSPFVG
jgi:hypothetical protein